MIRSRFTKSNIGNFDSRDDDVNPMENVANLSDVMLVLAVGMMLAVIIAWQVDIGSVISSNEVSQEEMVEVEGETLGETDDSQSKSPEDYGFYEAGKLYKDADGNYYMLPEE